jgi:hypothetical protein
VLFTRPQAKVSVSGTAGWPSLVRVSCVQSLHRMLGDCGAVSGGSGTAGAGAADVFCEAGGPSLTITSGRVDGPAVQAASEATASVVASTIRVLRRRLLA